MGKSEKATEEKLLSVEEAIEQNLEQKRELEIQKALAPKEAVVITDFDEVPSEYVLTDRTVFNVFNARTKTETELTGSQVSALCGLNKAKRKDLAKKNIGAMTFEIDSKYIKFARYEE